MANNERHIWLELGLTESEAKALASACCTMSKNGAIKSFGEQLAFALAHSDPKVMMDHKWESQAVSDYHASEDCTVCEVEKIHTESNDEMCMGCLTELHPDHWAVKEAA